MAMQWCDAQKHMYDAEAYESCPFCGEEVLEANDEKAKVIPDREGKTQIMINSSDDSSSKTVMLGQADFQKTKRVERASSQTTIITANSDSTESLTLPAVGWLVIVEGPGKGKDFRLIQGNNKIGRDKGMEVCLDLGVESDSSVSRDSHAIVVYDNHNNEFFIERGDSRNLPMINGKTIRRDSDLVAGDVIELGNTKLKFMPFCSDSFHW
jgi:hypothetical protein